ncbi:hypothetical protein [Bradyrhizobium sp. CB1015]|uniref:hypothetical protein n=1 Tax=Bradyrhizobium sp. CB1015 TaxID=2976822 RepID=UPI0021AA9F91|nr:hypothetical protein [Bradyrhizobium sp. CB1015]UWU91391.1 hypothetical protein N2604_33930 [Bradyrhizobium sp. CB1015]
MRALLLFCGLLGIVWAKCSIPIFVLISPARDVVTRIIADERFKPGVLADALVLIKASPRSSMMRSEFFQAEALLTLRVAEQAMQRRKEEKGDNEVEAAEGSLKMALAANPSSSFLWLMLYSVETVQNGFDPTNISYLDRSYNFGPLEGWIAVRRNRLALAIFPMLSEVQQDAVVSEFAQLVDANFADDAAMNLISVGWAYRERLLSILGKVDISSRQALSKRLAVNGVKLAIPGIEVDERPWR